MQSFEWNVPTSIVYGPGQLAKTAKKLSGAIVAWLKGTGMRIRFSDVNIGSEKSDQMTDDIIRMYAQEDRRVPGPRPMERSDILEILRRSL